MLSPSHSVDRPFGRWLFILVGLFGGATVGILSVAVKPVLFLALIGVVLVPMLIASRPLAGLWLLLGSTCFISIYSVLPGIPIQSIHVPDLLLMFLYGMFFWMTLRSVVRIVHTAMDLPFFVFIGTSVLSLLYGTVMGGAIFFEAIREFKVLLYYSLFILVVCFVRDSATLRGFIAGCLSMGIIASANLIAGSIVKPPAQTASADEIYYGITGLVGGGGGILIYWCLCCFFTLLFVDRIRPFYVIGLGMTLLYYMLKFHRHMYLIIALSFMIIGVLVFKTQSKKVLSMLSLLLVLSVLIASGVAWGPPSLSRFADLSLKRLASLHGIKETSTVKIRLLENQHAIEKIKNNPVIGIGFAKIYRPKIYGPNDAMGTFVHNGYLGILVKTGLLGFVSFMWFCFLFIRRSLRYWRWLEDPFLKAVTLGSSVTMMGLFMANTTSPSFLQDWSVAAAGLMIGVVEVAIRLNPNPVAVESFSSGGAAA